MRSRKFHSFLKIAFLAALVWLVYSGALHGPFTFDDWHVIPENPSVRGPGDIPSFFTDPATFSLLIANRDYRPIFLTSMALCWWVGGGSTFPFHVVSVLLHMSNVLLLYLLLRRFFAAGGKQSDARAISRGEWGALLAAALFAVHPLASQSINYISSQSVPLAAAFYLLGFYSFCTVHDGLGRSDGWAAHGRRTTSYVAYFLALMAKPIAITLPLNLVLWDLMFGERVKLGVRIRKHLPFAVVTVVYLLIRKAVLGASRGPIAPERSVVTHYLTEASALVFYYLRLAVAPFGLNVDPEYPVVSSVLEGRVIVALVVLAVLAGLLVRFRRQRVLVFWSLWFPSCLLITTFVVILPQVVNEHRVYLSLAGFCAVVGWLVVRLWNVFPVKVADLTVGTRFARGAIGVFVIAALVTLAMATHGRGRVWSSELSLWEDSVRHGGGWRPHMNYALALESAGRSDEALANFEKAVQLGPYAFPHLNLGNALISRAEYERGLWHLREAVRLWPTLPETRLYLGYGLSRAGRAEEAEREMLAALELRPDYLKGHRFLARLYQEQGQADKAAASYQRLYDLGARDAETLFAIAFAHQKRGDRQRAIELYEELLAVAPDHRQGNFNLAYAYKNGDTREEWSRSVERFLRVLEIDPGYDEALHHLATALWQLENASEAVRYDRLYLESGQDAGLRSVSAERLARHGSEPADVE